MKGERREAFVRKSTLFLRNSCVLFIFIPVEASVLTLNLSRVFIWACTVRTVV